MLPNRAPRSDAALASMGLHRLRTRIRVMGIVKNVRVIRRCGVVVATAILKSDLLLGMAVLLRRRDKALVVLVADETWVIARWESDAFTSASARCHTLVVVGITVCSATPRSHFESCQRIQFDEAMEPPKENRKRKVFQVGGIPEEQADQFYDFGPAHEYNLSDHRIPTPRIPCHPDDERVEEKGERAEGRNMQSVCRPWLLFPDMSLSDETSVVATPVASGPTGTLVQELDVVLQSGLDFAFPVVLDPSLPLV